MSERVRAISPDTDPSQPAYERLFGPFRARVTGYLNRLTGGNRADAEDLAQDTFLAAYQQRETFRDGANPLAYLMGIARRRWRDSNRSRHETEELDAETVSEAASSAQLIDRLTLQNALARLSEPERRALELTAVEGRTYREAAAILGEPEGTLKWRVHEATRKLRILLLDGEGENR